MSPPGDSATNDDGALAALIEERAIERLLVRYCRLVDDRRIAEVPALFEPDGRLDLMGRIAVGRAAIAEVFAAGPGPLERPVTSHVLSNMDIDLAGNTARCTSDLTVVTRHPDGDFGISLAARYHDELQRSTEWRFASRRVVVHGRAAPTGG